MKLNISTSAPRGPGSAAGRKCARLAAKVSKLTIELAYAKKELAAAKEDLKKDIEKQSRIAKKVTVSKPKRKSPLR